MEIPSFVSKHGHPFPIGEGVSSTALGIKGKAADLQDGIYLLPTRPLIISPVIPATYT